MDPQQIFCHSSENLASSDFIGMLPDKLGQAGFRAICPARRIKCP